RALAAATTLGIPVLRLLADKTAPAGSFVLAGDTDGTTRTPVPSGLAAPDELALLLHTSGTNSRPKLVQLTHANLAASARNIGRSLQLTPADLCLNVMPLFHIHGLVAAVLASLAAGAS